MTVLWLTLGVGLIGFALSIHHFYEKRIGQNERATTDSPEIYVLIAALFFLVLMGVTVIAMLSLPLYGL